MEFKKHPFNPTLIKKKHIFIAFVNLVWHGSDIIQTKHNTYIYNLNKFSG